MGCVDEASGSFPSDSAGHDLSSVAGRQSLLSEMHVWYVALRGETSSACPRAKASSGLSLLASRCVTSSSVGEVAVACLTCRVSPHDQAFAPLGHQQTGSINQGEFSASSAGPHSATTLVVRNIPAQYTTDMLLEEWECDGSFNYVYMPRNCVVKRNLSYAFINFISEELAATFRERWHRSRLARHHAQKALNIGLATVQGLDANLARLEQKQHFCSVPGRPPPQGLSSS